MIKGGLLVMNEAIKLQLSADLKLPQIQVVFTESFPWGFNKINPKICTYGIQMVLECIVILPIVVLIKTKQNKTTQDFSPLKYMLSREFIKK